MTNKIRRAVSFARENRYFIIAFAFLALAVLALATVFSVDNIEGISALARILINAIGIPVALASLWGANVAHWYVEDQLAEEHRRARRS